MNYLTDKRSVPVDAQNPLHVRDVGLATEREAISAESVTFVTGAAGFTGKVALDKAPVTNLQGNKVGSFWRMKENLALAGGPRQNSARAVVTAVTETATAADVTIFDPDYNLEQLFESPAATAKARIVIRDPAGGELSGYIGGVSASGSTYVLSIYNSDQLTTQSWIGTLANHTFANEELFEIYWNETSLAWVTGTILTQEVKFRPELSEVDLLDSMSNGDYAVDYQKGMVYYKKATTGTSDTVNYSVLKTYQSATISGTVTVDSEFPAAAAAADDQADPTTTSVRSFGMVYDGSTWDRMRGDATNGVKVQPATGGAGAVSATVSRVTLASDDPAVVSLQLVDDAVYTDDTSTITPGTSKLLAIGGQVDDTGTDTADEGDAVMARFTARRAMAVTLDTLISGEDQTNGLMKVGGTGALFLGKAEDAAHTTADTGVMALAVRKATPANVSDTDGDYEPLQVSAGRLWASATIDAALPAGTNAIGKLAANSGVDIGDVDVTSVIPGTGATNSGKAVDSAAGATDTGSATLAVRDDALSTLTPAEGDYANLRVDANGALWTHDDALDAALDTSRIKVEEQFSSGRATADTQIKASAGFVHAVSVAGLTATPTAGLLTIYDNTAESGTKIWEEWVTAAVQPHTVILDVVCSTGIYVGFDASLANIGVTVSYR